MIASTLPRGEIDRCGDEKVVSRWILGEGPWISNVAFDLCGGAIDEELPEDEDNATTVPRVLVPAGGRRNLSHRDTNLSMGATRDVDAVFVPSQIIRTLSAKIGIEEGIGPDWLNDAVKRYLQKDFGRQEVLNLSHLRVWAPDARYMLSMKCISARWDTSDRDDVLFLIGLLKLTSTEQVFSLIESYYPKNQIPSKTQFFVEEIFESS